jgi:hypothetical protein
MAGHRKTSGRAVKAKARISRFQRQLANASTVEDQLAAAYDWFRIASRGRAQDRHAAATWLANEALRLDRSPR